MSLSVCFLFLTCLKGSCRHRSFKHFCLKIQLKTLWFFWFFFNWRRQCLKNKPTDYFLTLYDKHDGVLTSFQTYTNAFLTVSTLCLLNLSSEIISIQAVQQVFYSSAGPVPLSVYQRLKRLEDRILELEGLSPEYFQSTVSLDADVEIDKWKALDNCYSVFRQGSYTVTDVIYTSLLNICQFD